MRASQAQLPAAVRGQIKTAFAQDANSAENLALSHAPLGQRCPHQCPHQCPHPEKHDDASNASSPLGAPMTIAEVAELLGCSPWTVRQKYLPQGLPHLRTSAGGRLVFFRLQVIRWILKRQEIHTKGGVKK
jgi:hypothetical protein